ncbi:MAG: DUF3108 domain-containing protein [Alphaproteobacteria bacterium]|nr:DUF3108 domain-containing protein [Alphaproteobacteria bacterium]
MKKTILYFMLFFCLITSANAYQTTHYATAFLGPFNASNANFTYNITPQSYLVHTNIETFGVFGTLYPFKAEYQTTGNINKNIFMTTGYRSASKSRFNTRKKEMFYDEKGKPTYRISNKNGSNKKKVEILPPPDNIHTTDLQTVLAEIIVQFTKMGFCNARMHVFDGKKNFDIIFNDEGKEDIISNEFSPFSGKAIKCSFYADDLGKNYDDLIFQITPSDPIYVWILKDKKTNYPFIAKLEKPSTILGKLIVYTNKLEIKE